MTPVPAREVLFGKTGKIHTVQLHHFVIELFEDPAHNAVAARVYLYTDLVLRFAYVINSIRFYRAILQLDPARDRVKITALEVLIQADVVYFFNAVTGVGEPLGEFPVIGKK